MADNTTNLQLPFLVAAQAQKHVTHNLALQALDAIVMLSVLNRHLAAPPGAPSDGARYLVAETSTGAWSGQAGKIAAWQDGAWAFHAPREGWTVWVADEGLFLCYDGAGWISPNLQNVSHVGVGAMADSVNRLAVAAAAVLLTHAGASIQVKLNKNAANDTASLLFQDNWSGRAELGLCGDNDFHLKVSADGSDWLDAMKVSRSTGGVEFVEAVKTASRTKASLPSPSQCGPGAIIYVEDEVGGPVLAFSDGENWRRVTDRAVVT